MNDIGENKYWAYVWSLIAAVLVLVVITIGITSMVTDVVTANMVEKGVDPIKAYCATHGFQGSNAAVCTVAIGK